MKLIRDNEDSKTEISEFVREMEEAGLCEITKDDVYSLRAKAVKRIAFSIQFSGIIFQAKEISLVSNGKEENEEEREYNYMFLDKNSFNIETAPINWNNPISLEMVDI